MFSSVDQETKTKFFRVLDLSLRSPILPSKMIAAFIKRLARVMISQGTLLSVNETMFSIAMIANLIKRHPRCLRLVQRKKLALSTGIRLSSDPYKENEKDPLLAKALKSSLWEIQILMKKHYDQRVRDFCKLFRTNFLGKTVFYKAEDFISLDPLNSIITDLE